MVTLFRRVMPFFLLVTLIATSLACGTSDNPTKVGTVNQPTQEEQQPPASGTTDQPEDAVVEPTAPEEEVEGGSAAAGSQKYQVGDVISIGKSVMVVLGWEEPEGDSFAQPEAGNKFVAVDVLLVNQGSSEASISTLMQMSLKDETGQKYDVDLMGAVAAEEASIDGELAPGERIRGKVAFQVPQDAKGLEFVFDASIFGTGKVFVSLGDTPTSVEPPAELQGETEQELFKIGDIIEIGNITLTVNEISNPEGDQFNKPDEGHRFLVVDLTIENKGTEAESVSSMLQMWVKDSTGQKYDLDLTASVAAGGSTPDGEIAPGEKLRGQVGYQVPQDAEGLVFVFDGDVFGKGKIFVDLTQ